MRAALDSVVSLKSVPSASLWIVSYLFVGVFRGIEALILLALLFNFGVGHGGLGKAGCLEGKLVTKNHLTGRP
jgi:hypothetical protein